ncbi:MAG TPA: class I SAM-dependent methyltransferase [Actinomycetota bacterium]|nr:class I SAM-dependent methyltransferase [Actinomycetota bacterium]
MDPWLRNAARRAIGFMPDDEGMALYEAALEAAPLGPILEIGSYCGRSTLYLAGAVRDAETGSPSYVVTIDHHRGSEEHQPGEEYHDARLVNEDGVLDTLATFRRTIEQAGVEDVVVAIVARSQTVAQLWRTPLGMAFIDGGHSSEVADGDLDSWSPHVVQGGLLAIHDVFPDPDQGGRPPYEIYLRALSSGAFEEVAEKGSLRVLRRTRPASAPARK